MLPRLMSPPYITQYATVLSHEHFNDLLTIISRCHRFLLVITSSSLVLFFEQAQETQPILMMVLMNGSFMDWNTGTHLLHQGLSQGKNSISGTSKYKVV
jgi:hypothetical protein